MNNFIILNMDWPKIVAMYRLKNEERWIEKSLDAASSICDSIVVIDNGSTDNTVKICKSFPKVVEVRNQHSLPFDDTRDKNTLLQMALERDPDYVLTLDGDEILQVDAKDLFFEELTILYPEKAIFEFEFLYMWDKPDQYRYDGSYSMEWFGRLLKISPQPADLKFDPTNYPGNGHCPHLPQKSVGLNKSVRSRMKIFHYGFFDEGLRQEKFQRYNRDYPSPYECDGYIHTISGKGKFSGPHGIELRTLPKGKFIKDIK